MSQINRVPFGLQDLLASKNFGDNPNDLAQVVAPVLDIEKYFETERYSYYHGADVIPGGTTALVDTTRVPEGELWFLHAMGIKAELTATGAAVPTVPLFGYMKFPQNSNDSGNNHPLCQFDIVFNRNLPSTASVCDVVRMEKPIPLWSGTDLQWFMILANLSTATVTMNGYAEYTKLKI